MQQELIYFNKIVSSAIAFLILSIVLLFVYKIGLFYQQPFVSSTLNLYLSWIIWNFLNFISGSILFTNGRCMFCISFNLKFISVSEPEETIQPCFFFYF
jgi:hypothetical protein